jgi:hypothetical protein
MSFGFSVGDFLAAGKLSAEIISSLKDAGGAKSEYQEVLRELECLNRALQHLDQIQCSNSTLSKNLDSIKYAAASCRHPLEEFLKKIKKYNKSLGVWGKEGVIKGTADKLRWTLGRKGEVAKLQCYLNIHVGTINMLLAEHGIEMLDMTSAKREANDLSIHERLEDSRRVIENIQGNVAAQALAVENSRSILEKLYRMINGEFSTSWKSLTNMIAKAW